MNMQKEIHKSFRQVQIVIWMAELYKPNNS